MKVHKAREKWVSMRFIQKITLDYDWIAIISMLSFFSLFIILYLVMFWLSGINAWTGSNEFNLFSFSFLFDLIFAHFFRWLICAGCFRFQHNLSLLL